MGKPYSFRKNLAYMRMAFYNPRRLIECFLTPDSIRYGAVPLVLSEILYIAFGGWIYLSQHPMGWSLNPLARTLHLTKSQMSLIQVITHPIIGFADIFLFTGIVYVAARLLQVKHISLRACLVFFLFLWGTFGCLALLVDLIMLYPPLGWNLQNLMYLHPLIALAATFYLTEYIHCQAGAARCKSAAVAVSGYAVVLASRIVFIP